MAHMDQITIIKNLVLGALASAFAVVSDHLGGWDVALQVLIGFMVADYLTGLVVAGVFRRSDKSGDGALDSRAGFKGLVRKGCILVLVYLGALLDKAVGATYVRTAICFFFVANEGLSILENIGLMGVSYPKFLRDMLQALKDKNDSPEAQ